MSKRDTLTLRRIGDFSFITVGDNHCGIAPPGSRQEAAYEVVVKCRPILDNRDYVFEQRTIDAYFQNIKRVKSSCERLVMRAADELVDVIMGENPSCEIIWIEVQIIAAPGLASMKYRFHP